MERLVARKKLFLTVAITSAVLGIVSIAGIIFFILKLLYVPMVLCIIVTAHGFYGCPFYFIAYDNAKKCKILLLEIQNGEKSIKTIAERAGLKVEFAEKLIEKAISKGYIDEQTIHW